MGRRRKSLNRETRSGSVSSDFYTWMRNRVPKETRMRLPQGMITTAKALFQPIPTEETPKVTSVPPVKPSQSSSPVSKKLGTNPCGDPYRFRWLLMDRLSAANDNAEHLYEYAREHCPDIDLWFVLERNAPDWERLQQKGFKLVAPRSNEHNTLLEETDAVISSHADHPIISQFESRFYQERRWRYVFLQHGITKDDLSRWLNGKHIDMMVTSSVKEHESIIGDMTRYDLTEREVVLTGFPRHDRLIRLGRAQREQRVVLFAPTWRREVILPLRDGRGSLQSSNYWQEWDGILRSNSVRQIIDSDHLDVVLLPHPDVAPFLETAEYVDLGIRVATYEEDIQQLLARTAIGVTDYSSLVFDLAVLGTPTAYFQFDRDEFFSGQHVYDQGYFDYERDGFGPVLTDSSDIETVLSEFLSGIDDRFVDGRARALEVTPWRDGKNCERTIEAILTRLTPAPVRSKAFGDEELGVYRASMPRRLSAQGLVSINDTQNSAAFTM
ncbi:CDP-glycerol glycerophosphotransferase family protein [Leucobacter sp. USHLN153]|uniref:CDP-glycerol glycerophosphotransferase family protein n=1 Tax=Leucobacter sp. USHLN153 TaxID=3081268 RepID=UPI0030167EE6